MATIGKVTVRPSTRTTIASPNFTPRVNVALSDIADVDVSIKEDGQVLAYNATEGKFTPVDVGDTITIETINGGTF